LSGKKPSGKGCRSPSTPTENGETSHLTSTICVSALPHQLPGPPAPQHPSSLVAGTNACWSNHPNCFSGKTRRARPPLRTKWQVPSPPCHHSPVSERPRSRDQPRLFPRLERSAGQASPDHRQIAYSLPEQSDASVQIPSANVPVKFCQCACCKGEYACTGGQAANKKAKMLGVHSISIAASQTSCVSAQTTVPSVPE
jgi:hypothetical protein